MNTARCSHCVLAVLITLVVLTAGSISDDRNLYLFFFFHCYSKEAIVRESYKRFDQFEKQVETTKVRYFTGTPQQDGIKHSTNTKRESNKEPIQISLLEKLKTTLEDWFKDSSISKLQEDDTTEDQKLINTDAASFQLKALNFLSNNPEWVTEAEISESFKEIMKMKSEDNKVIF